MENSKIEWTDDTFNIVWGCTKVSPACQFCYAEAWARRYGFGWGPKADRRVLSDHYWQQPFKWQKRAAETGVRERVFCSSMADVFEDHVTVAQERLKLWALIEATPNLDWQLLTKRPENMTRFAPLRWTDRWPDNVWAMTTAENQRYFDQRWEHLKNVPARVLGLSMEPLLSAVDISRMFTETPERSQLWVIAGGESGAYARETPAAWFENVRDQCVAHGTPFFFKQWGEYRDGMRMGKKRSGRVLDGITWDELPNFPDQ